MRHLLYLSVQPANKKACEYGPHRTVGWAKKIDTYNLYINADLPGRQDVEGFIKVVIGPDGIPVVQVSCPDYRVEVLRCLK